ncbi:MULTISPECIES: helix-turn-helix domain-containing protein [Enterococcus]|uniref:helix-turn-helix domain-containing protein n=1 Tax=Enterococcus TaxID=1350 RepID=UPI00298C377E|nr:DNA-binding protein [Enterococcus faecium]
MNDLSVLQINEIDLSPKLQEVVKKLAAEEGRKQAEASIEALKEKLSMPRYMNYTQAAKYMNTSYNTLKYVFIKKKGLPVVIIEGYERIRQSDADEFLEKYKK